LIRALFFDYDGVLTTDKTGSFTTSKYLSQALGIQHSKVQSAFRLYNKELTLGLISHADIWSEICQHLGQAINIELLYEAFESTPINTEMFLLAQRLKDSYVVGLITDNKKDRMDHLKKVQPLSQTFNPIIVSAEVGADKSSSKIFLCALESAHLFPAECIFIDNNEANLKAASTLGFKTIFHDDEKNDIAKLTDCLKDRGIRI